MSQRRAAVGAYVHFEAAGIVGLVRDASAVWREDRVVFLARRREPGFFHAVAGQPCQARSHSRAASLDVTERSQPLEHVVRPFAGNSGPHASRDVSFDVAGRMRPEPVRLEDGGERPFGSRLDPCLLVLVPGSVYPARSSLPLGPSPRTPSLLRLPPRTVYAAPCSPSPPVTIHPSTPPERHVIFLWSLSDAI